MKTDWLRPEIPWPALRLAWLWYGLGALLLFAVLLLSLLPVTGTGVNDKFAHVVTYCVLSGWFSLLVRRPAALLWVVLALTGYGLLIEALQGATDYRYAEWADVAANLAGTGIGLIAFWTPCPRVLRGVDRGLSGILQR